MALRTFSPDNEKKGVAATTAKDSSARYSSKRLARSPWHSLALRNSGESQIEGVERAPSERASLGSGRPLDAAARLQMERGFGASLDHIRVHTGADAAGFANSESARAVTFGNDIAFGAGEYRPGALAGDLLIAHEVAHALQQRGDGYALSSGLADDQADQAALHALTRLHGGSAPPAAAGLTAGGGLALRRCDGCGSRSNVQRALDGEIAWTPALAQQALDQYRSQSEADRQQLFNRYYPTGVFQRLLQALPPGAASGAYNDLVQDILRRAQRAGAFESARASGLADEAAMAQTQADFMRARNEAAARAAQPALAPPPTTAQVAAQQQTQVAQTSIAPSTSTLSPAEVASWTARANTAVAAVVSYARAHHPELSLTAADFYVDIVGIENRGQGVIAYGSVVGGRNVAVVGRTFVRYVDANPAYAMSVVVHELRGHPEYGPYGQPGTEYGLTLYDQAAARMPGYTRPVNDPAVQGDLRDQEIDAYAYQETEIYSLLRSLPYHATLAAADSALQPNYVDPEPTVRGRIALIKQQWEPRIAKALLRGLYQRLRLDPRITPAALQAFERSVRANYTGAEASTANDILR